MSTSDYELPPLRIACFGWVSSEGGSASSSNFLVFEELLRLGHKIDFFGIKEFSDPRTDLPTELKQNFNYFDIPLTNLHLSWNRERFKDSIGTAIGAVRFARIKRRLQKVAGQCHRHTPHDACLFFGRPPDFRLPGVPSVAWVQGAPHTELQELWKLRREVAGVRSWWFVSKLLAFRLFRTLIRIRTYRQADHIVCGSSWTRERILEVIHKPESVTVLPSPIDMVRFSPSGKKSAVASPVRLLWLGRIEPRKRFPLLIEAIELLLSENFQVQLRVYGDWTYTASYKERAQRLCDAGHVLIMPAVGREAVVALLRQTDILVQPSEAEDFGYSVAEALSVGVPVVVGARNGTAQYLPSACGVFASQNARALATEIQRVAEQLSSVPGEVQQQCREAAESAFDTNRIATRLVGILRQPHLGTDTTNESDL